MKKAEFFSELKKHNLTHLESSSGVSRQALHNALKSQNMKLDNLQSVAKAMKYDLAFLPLKNETNVLGSLAHFGVPVAHSKDGTLSFEDTVQESLLKARTDGAYETFVPYALVKNVKRSNPLLLAAKAFEVNQVNALGYFVELAHKFRSHESFAKLLEVLKPAKNPVKEFLVMNEKTNFPELFEKNHLALKWNLKTRGTVDDHLGRWEKWEQSQKNR